VDYDVIIAGGGMAGLTAASALAKDGLNVLLIERKGEVAGPARADASIFYWKFCVPDEYIEPVNVVLGTGQPMLGPGTGIPVTARFEFPGIGFSYEYAGPIIPYYNYLKMSPSGYRVWCIKNELWGMYLSRSDILRCLYQNAIKSGAKFMLGSTVTSVENINGGAVVTIQSPEGLHSCRAGKVIAADGRFSRVVHSLGLNRNRVSRKVVVYCYILEGVERREREYGTLIAWDYPSISPMTIFLGLHSEGGNNNLEQLTTVGDHAKAVLDTFMKDSRYASWFSRARIVRKCSTGGTDYSPIINNPVAGNVLIIGDAIGAESFIQGAIAGGYQAAKAIKRELNGEPGFEEYNRWLHGAFAFFCTPDHFHQKMVRHLFGLARPDDDDVDYVYSLIEKNGLVCHPAAFAVDNLEMLKESRPQFYRRLSDAVSWMKRVEANGGWQSRQLQ